MLLGTYPEPSVVEAILGICEFGARIGYTGHRDSVQVYPNLASAEEFPEIIAAEIKSELKDNRLECHTSLISLPSHFTASPLGLTDKADGSKRRIHHLSYPTDIQGSGSINGEIPEEFGRISYSSIADAIAAIQRYGKGCLLVKRDFASAFRHIPVSPLDCGLLGFHWKNKYYIERFLPFGLRTAPFLFNLFAELFHWILDNELEKERLPADVIHYLDDFLIILPPNRNLKAYTEKFTYLCRVVGLAIKEAKNEEGIIGSFGGIELDTENMVIRLPTKKLFKARTIVESALNATSLSLHELQKITGYLNFASVVIPLGRTFLRRLYNMQLYFPDQERQGRHSRRRMSREAQLDLKWWKSILAIAPERTIQHRKRDTIALWSDASTIKGLGAFYISTRMTEPGIETFHTSKISPPHPFPGAAFSMSIPRYISRNREHINTKEMRAVEQALLHWGRNWRGMKVVMHIDNRAVVHGIANRTIRGATMNVLRRCLLIAAEHDLEIETQWISTKDNALADALSRFDFDRIANLAPQLLYPTTSLRDRGFLTYKGQAFHQSQPITFGVA